MREIRGDSWAGFDFSPLKFVWANQRKLLLALTASSFMAAGAVNFFVLRPSYLSSAVVMPKPRNASESMASKLSGMLPSAALANISNAEVSQLTEILKSRVLSSRVEKVLTTKLVAENRDIPQPIPNLQMTVSGQIFKLSVISSSAELSHEIVRTYLAELQSYLTEMTAVQSRRSEEFIGARVNEVKTALNDLEDNIYKLRVSGPSSAATSSTEALMKRAQRDYSVQAKVLELLSQQYEMARIDAKREDLMFLVLDPPALLTSPIGPKRLFNTLLGGVLGFVAALLILASLPRAKLCSTDSRLRSAS